MKRNEQHPLLLKKIYIYGMHRIGYLQLVADQADLKV
jgi:hypothetical protein